MNEVMNVIKSRRSVRAYKPEQIKQEELDQILEAAIWAPTATNTQPWHFTVIQSKEVIDQLCSKAKEVLRNSESEWMRKVGMGTKNNLTYDAPTLIIVSGKKSMPFAVTDCSAAIENMLLAAESMDIGSVWLGLIATCFKAEGEAEKLGIPEEYKPLYGVSFGYKLDGEKKEGPARKRDVINYIR